MIATYFWSMRLSPGKGTDGLSPDHSMERSYMPFLRSLDADKWWDKMSVKETKFKDDENPFAVPDDHPAAKLRLTIWGVSDWILRYSINPDEQGQQPGSKSSSAALTQVGYHLMPPRQSERISPECTAH